MAQQEKAERDKGAGSAIRQNEGPLAKVLPWLILVGAVAVFAGAGFFVGRIFGTRGQAQAVSAGEPGASAAAAKGFDAKASKNESWFYDLDPVVANLNEPGVTRYVRVSLTLEITIAWLQEEARPFLDQKKPLMKHWLTLYLANLTIDEARGEKNLLRIQSHICDVLNQGLFSNTTGQIKDVLLREFAIQ